MANKPNRIVLTDYEKHLRRKQALDRERSGWDTHWREISEYLLPWAGRFDIHDKNRGGKKHGSIYDNTGTRSLRVLAAGMMAGMTSPARPWFRLTTTDPELAEQGEVKNWLHQVTTLMRLVFDRSNTYRTFHSLYEELGAFGTAADIVEPNFENVIHHFPQTIGQYWIAMDREGTVNTFAREFLMPVRNLVSEFGYENCSYMVQDAWNQYNLDAEYPVVHMVYPRAYDNRTPGKRDARNMPFASVYFELSREGYTKPDRMLRESGYREFPAITPRWHTTGADYYGSGPGMDALGDIKGLQHSQKAKAKGIDYQTDPPVQIPSAYKGHEVDLLPGGVSYVDASSQTGGIRNALDVRFEMQYLLQDIQETQQRIQSTFYADLFLMIANAGNRDMTAREVAERHEEKLLMLGPVLERLHNEMLSPMVDITFARLAEANVLPEPPPALEGMDLKVEFVSMLAQAQRAVGLGSLDRLIGTVTALAQIKPTSVDKLNEDQIIDEYAQMLGTDPDLIVGAERVAVIRQERAQAEQMQQEVEGAPAAAKAAKDLSEANLDGNNALSQMNSQLTGYSLPG